jgi:hypothetical protein
VEPVSTAAYGRFLPAWQQVGSHNAGIDGLAAVIDQLAGVPMPASAVEPLVFSQRVRDYQPAMLDELLAAGEVTWSGGGQIGGPPASDGWIAFHTADSAPMTLGPPTEFDFTDTHRAIMETLGSSGQAGGAYFFRQLVDGDTEQFKNALWELIWDHRRHVRSGAGDAVRHAPLHWPARLPGASASSTAAAAEPLQRGARAGPQFRSDGRGALVRAAGARTRIHRAGAFFG